MGDAFKCKNCGTVVETLQSCPSCGEAAMRPIRSSGDSDAGPGIEESATAEVGDADESSNTEPTDADESSNPEPSGTDESSNVEAVETDESSNDATPGRRRERSGRKSRSESGLLSWLKSLF